MQVHGSKHSLWLEQLNDLLSVTPFKEEGIRLWSSLLVTLMKRPREMSLLFAQLFFSDHDCRSISSYDPKWEKGKTEGEFDKEKFFQVCLTVRSACFR